MTQDESRYRHPCPACGERGANVLDSAGRVTCLLCTVRWPLNQRDPTQLRDAITSDPTGQLLTLGQAATSTGIPIGQLREAITHSHLPLVGRDSDNRRYIYSRHLDRLTSPPAP